MKIHQHIYAFGFAFFLFASLANAQEVPPPFVPPIIPPIVGPGPSAQLTWEYLASDITLYGVQGFLIYEGVGQQCDDTLPLTIPVGNVPAPERIFNRLGVPVADGVVCYEATAFNEGGESGHSVRVRIEAPNLNPAAPTNIIIELLVSQ